MGPTTPCVNNVLDRHPLKVFPLHQRRKAPARRFLCALPTTPPVKEVALSPSRLKRQRPDVLLLILTTLLFDGKWEGKGRKRNGGEMEQRKGKDERTDRKMGGVDLSTPLAYFV